MDPLVTASCVSVFTNSKSYSLYYPSLFNMIEITLTFEAVFGARQLRLFVYPQGTSSLFMNDLLVLQRSSVEVRFSLNESRDECLCLVKKTKPKQGSHYPSVAPYSQ